VGIIVRESKIVKTLLATFEKDWASTGFDELQDAAKAGAEKGKPKSTKKEAALALVKEMPPLQTTLKKAIKQAVARAGKEAVADGELKATVKDTVKTAMKEAVHEMAQDAQDS